MTGHTKGPYRADGPDEFGDYNILSPENALAVAAVVSNLRDPETVRANAYLIAAAPDLLEALEAVLSRQLDFFKPVKQCPMPFGNTEEYRAARAAIAKAKGKSQ